MLVSASKNPGNGVRQSFAKASAALLLP